MADTTTDERFESFEEFWPFYLGEHRNPTCRALHYVGTSLAVGTVGAAVLTLNPLWLLATPVVGYGPAWFAHYVVEGNRPATFKHPLWSLRGDFKMLGMALRGQIGDELTRYYGSPRPAPGAPRVDRPGSADSAAPSTRKTQAAAAC